MPPWFISAQATYAVGASYRQVDHWLRRGFGAGAPEDRMGSGTSRRLSFQQVFQLAVVKAVTDIGFSPSGVSRRDMSRLISTGRLALGPAEVSVDLAFIRDRLFDLLELWEKENGPS